MGVATSSSVGLLLTVFARDADGVGYNVHEIHAATPCESIRVSLTRSIMPSDMGRHGLREMDAVGGAQFWKATLPSFQDLDLSLQTRHSCVFARTGREKTPYDSRLECGFEGKCWCAGMAKDGPRCAIIEKISSGLSAGHAWILALAWQ